MKQEHGKKIPKAEKMKYASELIKLFPRLKDKSSKLGYVSLFSFNNKILVMLLISHNLFL